MGDTAAHARFSASGSDRAFGCFGSLALEDGQPDIPSRYAMHGTAAHEVASWCLEPIQTGGMPLDPRSFLGRVITVKEGEGEHYTEIDFEVDEEMCEAVETYCTNVMINSRDAVEVEHFVETKVQFGPIFGLEEGEGFGTSDHSEVVIDLSEGTIIGIDDFKFGQGVTVMAENNTQMRCYAIGVLRELAHLGPFDKVRMTIHQPRKDHESTEIITVDELMAWAEKVRTIYIPCIRKADLVFKTAFDAALLAGNDPRTVGMNALHAKGLLQPSEKGCQFCKARYDCVARREMVANIVSSTPGAGSAEPEDFEDLTVSPKAIIAQATGDQLAAAMQKVGLVEDWCKDIRAEIERRIIRGEEVPGYKLVIGKQGNRAWIDKQAVEARLKAARLRDDTMYDWKLISPTTAEKLAKAGTIGPRVWKELLTFITRSDGKPSVAPVEDKRAPISLLTAPEDFDDLSSTSSQPVDDVHPFR
jgi:hypothetical protein